MTGYDFTHMRDALELVPKQRGPLADALDLPQGVAA
jgi:hypothetical protein